MRTVPAFLILLGAACAEPAAPPPRTTEPAGPATKAASAPVMEELPSLEERGGGCEPKRGAPGVRLDGRCVPIEVRRADEPSGSPPRTYATIEWKEREDGLAATLFEPATRRVLAAAELPGCALIDLPLE